MLNKSKTIKVTDGPEQWVNNLSTDQLVFVDQRTEGWPLVDYYAHLHNTLTCPSNIIFATSNLLEEKLYAEWACNLPDKITIISAPFYAGKQRSCLFYKKHIQYKVDNTILLYSCLNRILRDHRKALLLMLNHYNLLPLGQVSHDYFDYVNFPGYSHHAAFTEENLKSILLPLTIDQTDFGINQADNFFKETYLNTWFSLITETFFKEHVGTAIFFSEKIFKPIQASHPFILVGAPNSLSELRKLGFQTFDKWWDESYDTILDPVDRLDAICNLIKTLASWDKLKWLTVYTEMQHVLEHNLSHLLKTNWNARFEQLTTI